ncbi:zinicin-like metallopeptidase [Propionicimonas paludicola]|uniref:Zinicin-like metallopeptidase n=1 Tax=Propionicimonas paludicola TaxID=185243 RepID=A0A2A9CN88_9ACTN|nr:metallopeptidase family protein [Propionicimonas paludicola]PFG15917.1 zinicin-like metallopeptidase [Propionicimonas paludicola]
MGRRDRHGRGLRGPLAQANPFTGAPVRLPQRRTGAERFADYLRDAIATTARVCPQALIGVEIGFEDVPAASPQWRPDRVPLAAAIPGQAGRRAQVVLFRRPLEHRADNSGELRRLVRRALVEQLSALTGISLEDLDPGYSDGDDWD